MTWWRVVSYLEFTSYFAKIIFSVNAFTPIKSEFHLYLQNNSIIWHWFIWRQIFGMKVPGSSLFRVLHKKVSLWSNLVEQNVNNAVCYSRNRPKNNLECQKTLTRSTLLPEWSCTWHKTSRCQGRIRWWLWGRCSWRCSSCSHTGATAAHWSWMRTGSGGTRRWWRCSRSQHTGLWWWLCSPHLRSNRVMSAGEQADHVPSRPKPRSDTPPYRCNELHVSFTPRRVNDSKWNPSCQTSSQPARKVCSF